MKRWQQWNKGLKRTPIPGFEKQLDKDQSHSSEKPLL